MPSGVTTLIVFLAVASPAIAKKDDRIGEDVRTVLRRTHTPGATVLVLRDGKTIYSGAFGLRELAGRLPARMDTHYEIGSITKQFTAAAILQLRDAGKVDLDAKVSAYLPDVPHAGEVTLRQLLTHTSGLPDYLGLVSDEEVVKQVGFQQIMSLVAGKPFDFPPGTKASYSNTGYIILGRIIEVTSNQTYRDYIREHLLKPARMTETYTVDDEPSLPGMAKGYRHVGGKVEPGVTISETYGWSAGSLICTVGELEKWNEALAGGKIVPQADYDLMMTPQKTIAGEDTGYGLGLFIDTVNGQPRIGHTGGSYGFTTANFYFPRQKLRIIALTNNADNPEPGEIIANVVFDDLYPDLARAASRPAPGEDRATTSKAKAGFDHLQRGKDDEAIFAASLDAKLKGGLAQRLAGQLAPYGAPTAFIFKGRRSDGGKSWSDYLIRFGPGSTFKLSIALDGEGRISSLGFGSF